MVGKGSVVVWKGQSMQDRIQSPLTGPCRFLQEWRSQIYQLLKDFLGLATLSCLLYFYFWSDPEYHLWNTELTHHTCLFSPESTFPLKQWTRKIIVVKLLAEINIRFTKLESECDQHCSSCLWSHISQYASLTAQLCFSPICKNTRLIVNK